MAILLPFPGRRTDSRAMRILFASSIKTWGGGEEWMLSAALDLVGRGHEVVLAGRPRSALVARAEDAGLPVHEIRFFADGDFISWLQVYRLCRSRRFHAAILNMDRVLRNAGTAARAAGVPVVLPRRGSEFPLKDGFLYRWTYTRIATGVIVNSRATARTLTRDVSWQPATVHVLRNGVNLARFAAPRPRDAVRRELDLPDHAPVLLCAGELTERKNVALILDAVARLAGESLPWLLVAGEGPELDKLRRRADRLGIAQRVRFLGFRDDIPDVLAASDVLVHAARVEGFGYIVAEAMAAGLPVIATNASSLPEIVAPGTGILFAPDDVDSLVAALRVYLNDPSRRAADGARGRERARTEFSQERRGAELEQILLAAVGAHARD